MTVVNHFTKSHPEPVEGEVKESPKQDKTIPPLTFCTIWYFHAKATDIPGSRKESVKYPEAKGKNFSLWVCGGEIVKTPYPEMENYVDKPIQVAIADFAKTHEIHEIK